MRQPTVSLPILLLLRGILAQEPPAFAEQVDRLCNPLVAADVAVGFVVGVIDGETEFVRGYGRLARANEERPGAQTIYEIGSVSKVFTGLLLADAVQRGLTALDDPVQKHLPQGVSMPAFEGKPVLLWHLSTHTSGLPRLPDMEGYDPQDPYAHFTTERLFEVLPGTRVRWEPGSRYEYSNLAVGLLGAVLVRANKLGSYDELLRARILVPLQMTDSGTALDEAQQKRLAPPHDADGEPNHTWDLNALAGAGGIRSTVPDMLKFARAQITRPEALGKAIELSQQKRHDGAEWRRRRAWLAHRTRWRDPVAQRAGPVVTTAYVGVQPKQRRAVCILANTARGELDAVGERILQHLAGVKVEPLSLETPVAVERAVLQRYTGKYRMSPKMTFELTLRERGLFAQLTGQPACRLYPRSRPTSSIASSKRRSRSSSKAIGDRARAAPERARHVLADRVPPTARDTSERVLRRRRVATAPTSPARIGTSRSSPNGSSAGTVHAFCSSVMRSWFRGRP
jgi:CubicO group peptidase (beta-lactamase class C family)